MKQFYLSLAIVGLLVGGAAAQTVIVDDDFESYADDAALHQVWAGLAGSVTPGTPAEVESRFPLFELVPNNADFNGNTIVDAADYTVWRDHSGITSGATQSQGDANHDGAVNSADYDAWKADFGTTPSGGSGGQVVRHLLNYVNTNPDLGPVRVPDGDLVYQPPLDPNFQPDNSIFPSVGLEPIVLKGDIYADNASLQRNTIGLRSFFDGATANIIEMGFYNGVGSIPANVAAGAAADGTDGQSQALAGFAARVQLFNSTPGPNPDWQFFALPTQLDTNGNGLVTESEVFTQLGAGWHHFEVTIAPAADGTGHDITFTLDLLNDGINNGTGLPGVDGMLTFTDIVEVTQAGFNSLRIGGPSALYTTQEARFDNIYLSGPQVTPGAGALAAVPEPTSSVMVVVAIVALCGGMGSRRVMRSRT